MKLISPTYKQLNVDLHRTEPGFGNSAHEQAQIIADLLKAMKVTTVLDYGCGKGTLKPALERLMPNLIIAEYDPAIPGKDTLPQPAECVLCCDVMEHIEPEHLDDVIAHLRGLTQRALFASVATHAAVKTLADGRNAHLIVQNKEWWLERFKPHFRSVRAKDSDGGFVGLFTP